MFDTTAKQILNYYKKELAMHKRKELIKRGKPTGATISVRF